MKKVLFAAAFAAVLAVACTKETDVNTVEGTNVVTIKANIDNATKTTYAGGKTFAWEQNDQIKVLVSDGSTDEFALFTAYGDGATTDFTATLNDGFSPSGLAFYPTGLSPVYDSGNYTVTLSSLAESATSDPLAVVPLIGTKNLDDSYSFTTATGILKFSFTNVPAEAYYFNIYTDDTGQQICGQFTVSADNTIKFENAQGTGNINIWSHVYADASGNYEVYIPLPVGTLKAGAKIVLEDDNINPIFEIATTKDIEVVRNQVVEIATVNIPDLWTSLGTAKYYDRMYGMSPTDYVEVEIEQGIADPSQYRMASPYAVLGFADADPYMYFRVCSSGEQIGYSGTTVPFDGIVSFDSHKTGDKDPDDGYFYIKSLNDFSGVTSGFLVYSQVLTYKSDGSPSNIQLAPIYDFENASSVYYWGYNENNWIRIAMPGESFVAEDYLEVSAAFLSHTSTKASVSVTKNTGVESCAIGISNVSYDDAEANATTTITKSTTVSLNLPAEYGTFYVYVSGLRYGYEISSAKVTFSIAPATIPEAYTYWIGTWTVDNAWGGATDTETWEITEDVAGVSVIVSGVWASAGQTLGSARINATYNTDGTLSFMQGTDLDNGVSYYGLYNGSYIDYSYTSAFLTATKVDDTSATLTGGTINGYDVTAYVWYDGTLYGWNEVPANMTKVTSSPVVASQAPSLSGSKSGKSLKPVQTSALKLAPASEKPVK